MQQQVHPETESGYCDTTLGLGNITIILYRLLSTLLITSQGYHGGCKVSGYVQQERFGNFMLNNF